MGPVPDGWSVVMDPQEFDLPSGASRLVKVTITPPASFTAGTQAFNVHAFDRHHQLIGGVTLYTQR